MNIGVLIPDIGELMLASFPDKFNVTHFGTKWYLSILFLATLSLLPLLSLSPPPLCSFSFRWLGEKYDGLRCCWHPIKRMGYPITYLQLPLLISLNREGRMKEGEGEQGGRKREGAIR